MQSIVPYIKRHPFRTILIIALCASVPAGLMHNDEKYLINNNAPKGVISLELALKAADRNRIIQSWDTTITYIQAGECSIDKVKTLNILNVAKRNVWIDFVFILFYGLLGCTIILVLNAVIKTKHSKYWFLLPVWFSVIVCACDCIENAGMLGYLYKHVFFVGYAYFAWLKFILLIIFLVYVIVGCAAVGLLQKLSLYIETSVRQVARYRVLIIALIVFSLPVWFLNQGEDLLVNINSSIAGTLIFLAVITVTAFLNWYLSKLFFSDVYIPPFIPWREPFETNNNKEAPKQLKLVAERKAARFLGTITFLLIAFAINHALDDFQIDYFFNFLSPLVWFFITCTALFIIIRNDYITKWTGKIKNKGRFLFISLAILVLIVPLIFLGKFLILKSENIQSPQSLAYISIDLICFAIAFLIFVSMRESIVLPAFLKQSIGKPVLIAGFLLAFIFILENFFSGSFGNAAWLTFPLLICGCIFYVIFFSALIRASQKFRINLTIIVIILLFVVNAFSHNDYHKVRKFNTNNIIPTTRNENLADYYANWILHRSAEINTCDSNHPYPIFLVNAYGGGIRAAAFTSLAIAALDGAFVKITGNTKLNFQHYAFSYSGASGGTIGAAVMVADRYRFLYDPKHKILNDAEWINVYKKDYLTPVLVGMLGRDVLGASLGFNSWDDRSAIQEKLWGKNFEERETNINLENDFYSYWITAKDSSAYEIPLLFANTANVDDGFKGIMCPVLLNKRNFPTDILIGQDSALLKSTESMRLSTAAFLSARFPLLSASGKMGNRYHFIDGGTIDNSGATTSLNIYTALRQVLRDTNLLHKYSGIDTLIKKTQIYFISINNSPYKTRDPNRRVANPFQLTSFFSALYNSGVNANATRADTTLSVMFGKDYALIWPAVDCILLNKKDTKQFSPVLPLGWQISAGALERLDSSAHQSSAYRDNTNNDSLRIPHYYRIIKWLKP